MRAAIRSFIFLWNVSLIIKKKRFLNLSIKTLKIKSNWKTKLEIRWKSREWRFPQWKCAEKKFFFEKRNVPWTIIDHICGNVIDDNGCSGGNCDKAGRDDLLRTLHGVRGWLRFTLGAKWHNDGGLYITWPPGVRPTKVLDWQKRLTLLTQLLRWSVRIYFWPSSSLVVGDSKNFWRGTQIDSPTKNCCKLPSTSCATKQQQNWINRLIESISVDRVPGHCGMGRQWSVGWLRNTWRIIRGRAG